MIQITPHMRILVALEPIDFRAGIDGLVGACRQRLEADPFSGCLFVFRNRARTAIKILVLLGMAMQGLQIRERIDPAELTGMNQAHVDIPDLGPLGCLVEQRILAMQDRPLSAPGRKRRPLADMNLV